MIANDEAPGVYLIKAEIPDLDVLGVPATTFFVAASGTPEGALAAVQSIAPAGWPLEVSEHRLTLATVRRLGLRAGEARRFS